MTYRFQRVSPMEVSPHDPRVVYYGSQFVHRTRDGGKTWTRMSPDLTLHPEGTQAASGEPITRDATGEEVYSTLYSIRESPVQKGLIWTGSNDGLVFVSRDDGESWTNVTPAGNWLPVDACRISSRVRIGQGRHTSRSIDICSAISRRTFIARTTLGRRGPG